MNHCHGAAKSFGSDRARLRQMTDELEASRAAPAVVRRDYPLARLTTVRTGGPAQYFARPESESQLTEFIAWAGVRDLAVNVVGSGSNLLVADEGVRGLVLKLDGELASFDVRGSTLECGGGARLPSLAAKMARAGLAGIEFAINIPGTVGGAVRMNANAYGGQLTSALEWVDVVDARGTRRVPPGELGLGYRRSDLVDGEVVARACFALTLGDPAQLTATLAEMRARRQEAQPSGIKTFGSTFKNPADPRAGGASAGMLLARAGCNGLAVGGARFADKHANFVQNTGDATTADIVALMAEGHRRVAAQCGVWLEPEVQTLGPVRFPWSHS